MQGKTVKNVTILGVQDAFYWKILKQVDAGFFDVASTASDFKMYILWVGILCASKKNHQAL